MNRLLLIAFSASLALFVACGKDKSSSSVSSNDDLSEVQTKEDLAHCTKSHYGELVRVLEKDSVYECTSEGWVVADDSTIDDYLSAKSSSDKQENRDTLKSSSSATKITSSDVAEIEIKKVDSATVHGFAEKGPFLNGSAVTLYELDSNFAKTKVKFTGKVEGDSGYYSIKNIVLNRQYALIEVYGFYKNEITGKNTSSTKTRLSALVDMADSNTNIIKNNSININLMTELERQRVIYLVKNSNYNVPAAKRQATREIFELVGISSDSISKRTQLTSTNMSLASGGDEATALYILSIMLQGNLSVSRSQARINDVAAIFAETGTMKDYALRAKIADELNQTDSIDGFAAIRENAKALKIGKIPNFEKHLYQFWVKEYGLPKCSADNETEIAKVSNKESDRFGAGFVCTSERWHRATDLDTELGLCLAKREGEFTKSKAGNYYTCKSGSWESITETQYELKACTDTTSKKRVTTKSGEYYICSDKQWHEATENDYIVGYICDASTTTHQEKVDKKYYSCDGNSWTEISKDFYELGYCNDAKKNECTAAATSGKYYECTGEQWILKDEFYCTNGLCNDKKQGTQTTFDSKGYYCDNSEWHECGPESLYTLYAGKSETLACDFGEDRSTYSWRKALDNEITANAVCNEKLKIEPSEKTADKWIFSSDSSQAIYCIDQCQESMCGEGVNDYEWKNASTAEVATGLRCNAFTENKVKSGYTCEYSLDALDYEWRKATPGEDAIGEKCSSSNVYTVASAEYQGKNAYFACVDTTALNGYAWRTAESMEQKGQAVCNEKIKGKVVAYNESGNSVVCEPSTLKWRAATGLEASAGKLCTNENIGESLPYGTNGGIYCDPEAIQWQLASYDDPQMRGRELCWEKNLFKLSYNFVCDSITHSDGDAVYKWRKASIFEKEIGAACSPSLYDPYNTIKEVKGMNVRCIRDTKHGTHYYYAASYKDTRNNTTYAVASIFADVWMLGEMTYNVSGSKCYSTDSTDECKKRRLYTHYEARSVCPSGWGLPDTTAFNGKEYFGEPWQKFMTSAYGGYNLFNFNAEKTTYYNVYYEKFDTFRNDAWIVWTKNTFTQYSESHAKILVLEPNTYFRINETLTSYYLPVRCVLEE